MAKIFSDPDSPAPEEITQQVGRKPPTPDEITQQTRVKPSGLEQEPYVPPQESQPSVRAETGPMLPDTVVAATKPSAASLQPPRRTFFSRVGHALFSRQTRFGRFMRSVFATLVTVVFLFGVWAIAAYFLIYQPMTSNLAGLQVEATRTAGQLQQANSGQKTAEQRASALSTQTAQDQSRLQAEGSHVDLLRAMNAVSNARFALIDVDLNSAAKSLSDAQGYLNSVYPMIEKQDPKQSETIKALFTVASNDLAEDISRASGTTSGSGSGVGSTPTIDTSQVDQDLTRIQTELNQVEKSLK